MGDFKEVRFVIVLLDEILLFGLSIYFWMGFIGESFFIASTLGNFLGDVVEIFLGTFLVGWLLYYVKVCRTSLCSSRYNSILQ